MATPIARTPYVRLPETEIVLSEEEQILETFYRYAFGIDTVSFENMAYALAEDAVINMAPFGSMDKRTFVQTLKYQRMRDRHWIHPVIPKKIIINGDKAEVYLTRLAGHDERYLEFTPENVKQVLACGRYELKMQKESEGWKITKFDYLFGGFPVTDEKNQ